MSLTPRAILSGGAGMGRVFVYIATQHFRDLGLLLEYGSKYPSHQKRMGLTMEEMDALVQKWCDVLAGCLTAHSKADYDAADYDHDEILRPILSAPVKELREFGHKLCEALQADERIPYIVWRPFVEMLRERMVKITKDASYTLKERLARQIAIAVEEGVKPQIADAITDALKWRDEGSLKEVKTAIESGAKPKLTGRQSCLFLEVADKRIML